MMFVHPQATESEMGDVDLSGLPEAPVDSEDEEEDEDIERSSEALLVRDLVRECLEKDAVDRTDDDIGKAMNLSPSHNKHKHNTVITIDILKNSLLQTTKNFHSNKENIS